MAQKTLTSEEPGGGGWLTVSCPHCSYVLGTEQGGSLTLRTAARPAAGGSLVTVELTFKRLFTFTCWCTREVTWCPRPTADGTA
jgi:hypothetical protein